MPAKRSLVAKGDLYREESGMLVGSVPWWLRKRLSSISALHQILVAADKVVWALGSGSGLWAPVVVVIGAQWSSETQAHNSDHFYIDIIQG